MSADAADNDHHYADNEASPSWRHMDVLSEGTCVGERARVRAHHE
jgi:hypothetical protein